MKTLVLMMPLAGSILLAGCALSGQAQTEPGQVQLPGARAASTALSLPPDQWQAPPRQSALMPERRE
jgi:hypothetical protein